MRKNLSNKIWYEMSLFNMYASSQQGSPNTIGSGLEPNNSIKKFDVRTYDFIAQRTEMDPQMIFRVNVRFHNIRGRYV